MDTDERLHSETWRVSPNIYIKNSRSAACGDALVSEKVKPQVSVTTLQIEQ